MEDITVLERDSITTLERNKKSLQYGLLLGIIYIFITILVNMLVDNLIVFYCVKTAGYIAYFLIMGMFVSKIKKANGGYLEFKDAFSCVFIMVAMAGLFYFVFNYMYVEYINPQFTARIKAASVSFMEKMKLTDDQIEKNTQKLDKQIAESKNFNLGQNVLSYFESIILDSLFGLIVAAVVKKSKPIFAN